MNAKKHTAFDIAEKNGYLPGLRQIAKQSCVPFWWHGVSSNNEYKILHNGTLCLLDTGSNKIGITADHVYSEYLQNKQANPDIVCQIGGNTFLPENRVIDRSSELDLATFELSDIIVAASGGYFHAPRHWPTGVVTEGDAILLGGYPGLLREEHHATADIPFQWFAGAATSVSPLNVSLNIDFKNLHQPLKPNSPLNPQLGGMSGGPVFRLVPGIIEHLELVGFIYEYHESFELILARPTICLQSSGQLAQC